MSSSLTTLVHRRPIVSPLRYPGGKAVLYPMLREMIRAKRLDRGVYVEPFAGGAGAALALLMTGQVDRIAINDLDPAIYAFWVAVTRYSDEFSRRVREIEVSVDEWGRQKRIYQEGDIDNVIELGLATFFLNRTNRSGVMNGGPIGGKSQNGNYKIDARFNKAGLLERLRLIGIYANKIEVSNLDGREVIERFAGREEAFLYVDPPYFEKAGSLYLNSFDLGDHRKLAECLNEWADSCWLLTYDNVDHVKSLYRERKRELISVNYSVHTVGKVNEVMVLSDGLVRSWGSGKV